MNLIVLFLFSIMLFSCEPEEKFEKDKWCFQGSAGTGYIHRNCMLKDVLQNHLVKGKNFLEVESLFCGETFIDSTKNGFTVYLNIITDYGFDIDPVYTKDIYVYFNKDSIIKNISVKEYKRP